MTLHSSSMDCYLHQRRGDGVGVFCVGVKVLVAAGGVVSVGGVMDVGIAGVSV